MLRNQRGNILFWVINAILFIAIALMLILPSKYNLDPEKNTDDCTTNMKNIWVATSDYLNDFHQDYYGDPKILLTTRKKDDPKNYYLSSPAYCPESQGGKEEYIIFAKYSEEMLGSEMKNNSGILIFCPNLGKFPKHFLDKSFYDNMSTTKLQNYMIDDLNYIDQQTKSNGRAKNDAVMKYIEIWKTDPECYAKRSADMKYLKRMIFPYNEDLKIITEE